MKLKNFFQVIAIVLILSFTLESCGMAASLSGGVGVDFGSSPRSKLNVGGLLEYGAVKEMYEGSNGKTIFHVEDAHTNLSGQVNLAKTIEQIARDARVGVVHEQPLLLLVEGGAVDGNLSPLKKIASKREIEKAAKSLLSEGRIAGEEYLTLISDTTVKIQGIEDMKQYFHSARSYAHLMTRREAALGHIAVIENAVKKLKEKLYPREILEYEKIGKENFEIRIRKLIEMVAVTAVEARGPHHIEGGQAAAGSPFRTRCVLRHACERHGRPPRSPLARITVSDTDYNPNIQILEAMQERESSIDFNLANLEQAALLEELSKGGETEGIQLPLEKISQMNQSHVSKYAYLEKIFEIADKKKVNLDPYSNLRRYRDYLREYSKIDLSQLMGEMDKLEEEVYVRYLATEDERLIRSIDRYLLLLETAYRIQMSYTEFKLFAANERDFGNVACLSFINRKLAELGYFSDLVPLKNNLDKGKKFIKAFYQSVALRDNAFMRNIDLNMRNQKSAILITGGYHTENLKEKLKATGYSYVVLTPFVERETNQNKYESLLFGRAGDAKRGKNHIMGRRVLENKLAGPAAKQPQRCSTVMLQSASFWGAPLRRSFSEASPLRVTRSLDNTNANNQTLRPLQAVMNVSEPIEELFVKLLRDPDWKAYERVKGEFESRRKNLSRMGKAAGPVAGSPIRPRRVLLARLRAGWGDPPASPAATLYLASDSRRGARLAQIDELIGVLKQEGANSAEILKAAKALKDFGPLAKPAIPALTSALSKARSQSQGDAVNQILQRALMNALFTIDRQDAQVAASIINYLTWDSRQDIVLMVDAVRMLLEIDAEQYKPVCEQALILAFRSMWKRIDEGVLHERRGEVVVDQRALILDTLRQIGADSLDYRQVSAVYYYESMTAKAEKAGVGARLATDYKKQADLLKNRRASTDERVKAADHLGQMYLTAPQKTKPLIQLNLMDAKMNAFPKEVDGDDEIILDQIFQSMTVVEENWQRLLKKETDRVIDLWIGKVNSLLMPQKKESNLLSAIKVLAKRFEGASAYDKTRILLALDGIWLSTNNPRILASIARLISQLARASVEDSGRGARLSQPVIPTQVGIHGLVWIPAQSLAGMTNKTGVRFASSITQISRMFGNRYAMLETFVRDYSVLEDPTVPKFEFKPLSGNRSFEYQRNGDGRVQKVIFNSNKLAPLDDQALTDLWNEAYEIGWFQEEMLRFSDQWANKHPEELKNPEGFDEWSSAWGWVLDNVGYRDLDGMTTCDLASGSGIMAYALSQRGAQVTVLDGVKTYLNRVRENLTKRRVGGVTYIEDTLGTLSKLNNNTFDLMTIVGTLHLFSPWFRRIIVQRIYEKLKPGGTLLIVNSYGNVQKAGWFDSGQVSESLIRHILGLDEAAIHFQGMGFPNENMLVIKVTKPSGTRLATRVKEPLLALREGFNKYFERLTAPSRYRNSKFMPLLTTQWNDVRRLIQGEEVKLTPVYWEIYPEDRCNLNCVFCRAFLRKSGKPDETLSREHLLKAIEDAHALNPKAFIRFSGIKGEPLRHEAMIEALQRVNQLQLPWGLSTNGILMNKPGLLDELLKANYVHISMNAAQEKTHEKLMRSKPGEFAQLIENLKLLAKKKKTSGSSVEIVVSFLLQEENMDELSALSALLKKIEGIDIFEVKMQHFDKRRHMTQSNVRHAYDIARAVQARDNNSRYQVYLVQDEEEALHKTESESPLMDFKRCYAAMLGYSQTVSPNGGVHMCCHYHQKTLGLEGHVTDGLGNIWRGASFDQAIRRDPKRFCAGCPQSESLINRFIGFMVRAHQQDPDFLQWVEENYIRTLRGEGARLPENNVIPTQAGIQRRVWIPAYAGMTKIRSHGYKFGILYDVALHQQMLNGRDISTLQNSDAVFLLARAFVYDSKLVAKFILFGIKNKNTIIRVSKAKDNLKEAVVHFYSIENGKERNIGNIRLTSEILKKAKEANREAFETVNEVSLREALKKQASPVLGAFGENQRLLRLAMKAHVPGKPVIVKIALDREGLSEEIFNLLIEHVKKLRLIMNALGDTSAIAPIQIVSKNGDTIYTDLSDDITGVEAIEHEVIYVGAPNQRILAQAAKMNTVSNKPAGFIAIEDIEATHQGEFNTIPLIPTALAALSVARTETLSGQDKLEMLLRNLIGAGFKNSQDKEGDFHRMKEVRNADLRHYLRLAVRAITPLDLTRFIELTKLMVKAIGASA